MRDYNYIDDVEVLKDNILDEDCKIIYMKQKAEDYFIHIICCQFTDVESLKMNWKELVNNVSEVVQKRLNDLIEIYNVYCRISKIFRNTNKLYTNKYRYTK